MAPFEVTATDGPGHVRVVLAGECDLAVSARLTEALLTAVRQSPLVVVDLAALDFLDSSGVHGLVTAHHAACDRGGRVEVVNPAGHVATVLDVTGVGPLLSPSPHGGRAP